MSNTNWSNGGKLYIPEVRPVLINCSFKVAVADTGGLGITNLTGPKVRNVFMHTSATPGVGNNSLTNPNPASGTIVVQLTGNHVRLLDYRWSAVSPQSGSDVKIDNSAMTAGVAYVITTLGNATAAKWLAIGVPAGITAAVGVTFIAASNGGAGNTLTSRVQASATAGCGFDSIQTLGSPQLLMSPAASANQGYGASLIFQCRKASGSIVMDSYTPAGTNNGASPPIFTGTPATLTGTFTASQVAATPTDACFIYLSMYLSDSSVTVSGQ